MAAVTPAMTAIRTFIHVATALRCSHTQQVLPEKGKSPAWPAPKQGKSLAQRAQNAA